VSVKKIQVNEYVRYPNIKAITSSVCVVTHLVTMHHLCVRFAAQLCSGRWHIPYASRVSVMHLPKYKTDQK